MGTLIQVMNELNRFYRAPDLRQPTSQSPPLWRAFSFPYHTRPPVSHGVIRKRMPPPY